MSFDRFLGFGADACAVLDRRGTITAVNDVWHERARAAGATGSTGPGVDYLDVCRRAASTGAPRAQVAVDTLSDLLTGRTTSSAFHYPCTTPDGVAWFRADLVAVGSADHVGVRHVDVTARHLRTYDDPNPFIDSTSTLLTEDGLRWALADALDGPPHPAVLVMATHVSDHVSAHRGSSAATILVTAVADSGVAVDTVARLGGHTLVVVITAADPTSTVSAADTVVHAAAEHTGWAISRWAFTNAVAHDTADSLPARVRRSLLHPVTSIDPTSALVAQVEHADRTARLHAAAAALTDAIAEFDHALDRGVDMLQLRFLDQQVDVTERACLTAATACLSTQQR